jgi:GNAT superfamily N-acetyltransferase
VTLAFVPFPADQPSAVSLAEEALRVRLAPGEKLTDLLPPIVASIHSGRAAGGLLRSDGAPIGIALWEPAGPFGVAVRLLYLTAPAARPEGYREALDLVHRVAGPIAFVGGPLGGLSSEEEATLLGHRGFVRFHRTEMSLPPESEVPEVAVPEGAVVRPLGAEDERELARLHQRAYQDHIDWYLGLEDLDPVRDADRQVRDYYGGRYGDLVSPGSTVVTVEGRIVASVVAIKRPVHVLLVDVMSEPALHGRGFGRAALAAALRDLRRRGENAIVLNVTEENVRAVRMYASLGFVRSIGPSQEWFDARRMPARFPPIARG